MRPDAARVAARYFTSGSVQVEVLPKLSEKARLKTNSGTAIGRFLSTMPLYRVFDGEELQNILDTGEIKGGHYSVPAERAYGAQWGGDKNEVVKWGEGQRGRRLGHELFLAEIDGKGRVFAHLSAADGKMKPDAGTISLPASFCSTGLGCSVHAGLQSVKKWYVVENGKAIPSTLKDIRDLHVPDVGAKPRFVDLFTGGKIQPPPKIAGGLSYLFFREYIEGKRFPSRQAVNEVWEGVGLSYKDHVDKKLLGKELLKSLCMENSCRDWATTHAGAVKEAAPSAREWVLRRSLLMNAPTSRSFKKDLPFSVVVMIKANTTTKGFTANLAGQTVEVYFVDVYNPVTKKWDRLWQPWGKSSMTISKNGQRVTLNA